MGFPVQKKERKALPQRQLNFCAFKLQRKECYCAAIRKVIVNLNVRKYTYWRR